MAGFARGRVWALVAPLIIAGALPAAAHHSYAMFDMRKTAQVDGTIKQFDWTNPHTYIWLYVPNAQGGQDVWAVEGGSPNALSRIGWSKRTVSPGDKVKIEVHPLKDGRNGGFFNKIWLPNGTMLEQTHEGEPGGPGGVRKLNGGIPEKPASE
jgi:hypothetical protein